MISLRWYRPDPGSLSYLIVSRVFEMRVWKAQLVVYWYFR
jgi:hypothetical protein